MMAQSGALVPLGPISSGSETVPSCHNCKDFKERVHCFWPGSNLDCSYCKLAVLVCRKLFDAEMLWASFDKRRGNVTTMECTYSGPGEGDINHSSCTINFNTDVRIRPRSKKK